MAGRPVDRNGIESLIVTATDMMAVDINRSLKERIHDAILKLDEMFVQCVKCERERERVCERECVCVRYVV
ncbi:hypothetical protein Hanom_Chr16g01487471 [Helianthus anomalus]